MGLMLNKGIFDPKKHHLMPKNDPIRFQTPIYVLGSTSKSDAASWFL